MIEWKLEKRKLKDLKPHPHNPRSLSKHDAKHLQQSLERFGLIDKPIITQENAIIGGHQRVQILKKMGVKEVECYLPASSLSQDEIEELMIRLNRNVGDWDIDTLANVWDTTELVQSGFEFAELINAYDEAKEEEAAKKKKGAKKKNKCPECGHEF